VFCPLQGIINDKIVADRVDVAKGNPMDSFSEFVVEWFQNKHGTKVPQAKECAFESIGSLGSHPLPFVFPSLYPHLPPLFLGT